MAWDQAESKQVSMESQPFQNKETVRFGNHYWKVLLSICIALKSLASIIYLISEPKYYSGTLYTYLISSAAEGHDTVQCTLTYDDNYHFGEQYTVPFFKTFYCILESLNGLSLFASSNRPWEGCTLVHFIEEPTIIKSD